MTVTTIENSKIENNRAAARRFLEDIWSQGDLTAVEEILSPDFAFILSFMTTQGTDAFKNLVVRNREAFRNLTYIVEDVVAGEDEAAAYWRMESTHVGTWRNIEPTGKQVSIHGLTYYKFSNGKIVEAKVQNDVLGLMQQLDAVSFTAALKKNKESVRRYVEVALNKRDFNRFDEVITPSFLGHRGSQVVRGAEGLKAQMSMFAAAFPDIEFLIDDIFAEEDKVAVVYTAPGTHQGTFAGIAPTNKKVEWKGIIVYRLENGKVAELTAYWNDCELIEQLKK
ncbi:hypothetical protein NIES4103_02240 [Nostoc sp. NIES-4103]|nr:hypothetical protein NIES4103_02240 [Nostoc sp. NIES-4103]